MSGDIDSTWSAEISELGLFCKSLTALLYLCILQSRDYSLSELQEVINNSAH